VAGELSPFCKMARSLKVVEPRCVRWVTTRSGNH